MNVLRSSWRCSLAATALWAMLGPAQVDAAEGEGPRDRPKAAAEWGDRPRGEAREMMQRLQAAREGDQKRPDKEAPRAAAPDREVQALRNEVQQMRREMQEMRERMKKLLERERK